MGQAPETDYQEVVALGGLGDIIDLPRLLGQPSLAVVVEGLRADQGAADALR
jgi:hypothetical protein